MQASQPAQAKTQVSNGPVAAGVPVAPPSTSSTLLVPITPPHPVTPLKPIMSSLGHAPLVNRAVSVVTLSAERAKNPGGQVTTLITKTTTGIARVAAPHTLTGSPGTAIRPGISTKVNLPQKVLNISSTLPAGYKLSPLTFNIATSANGKSGVVPLVLTTSSSGNTVSLMPAHSATSLAGTSAMLLAGLGGDDGPLKKKPRLDTTIATLRTTAGGTVGKAPDPNAAKRRRRTTEDGVKGLRYFATKVCDKVREKSLTTYNSVAEDLVQEYSDPNPVHKSREEIACEQKNIRRRVYDALNVLMAINVIQKERKQIRWVGLPRSLSEAGVLKKDSLTERRRQLGHLRQRLFQSSVQYIALKELVEENKRRKADKLARIKQEQQAQPNTRFHSMAPELLDLDESQHIELPFLFVSCGNKCEIECSVSGDAKEYELRFSEPYKIIEDTEILRHTPFMRSLDKGTPDMAHLVRAVQQLPEFLRPRFPGLLAEHRERVRKLEETKKAQLAVKAAAEAERARQEADRRRLSLALRPSTSAPTAPLPPIASVALPTPPAAVPVVVAPVAAASGVSELLLESEPEAQSLQVAALHTGSPVVMKSKYYIQVSDAPVAPDMSAFVPPLSEVDAALESMETEMISAGISAVECT